MMHRVHMCVTAGALPFLQNWIFHMLDKIPKGVQLLRNKW